MNRFFVAPSLLAADPIRLDGDLARQMARVLRLRPGDRVVLLDGSGRELVAELRRVAAREVLAAPLDRRWGSREPACALTLYQGVIRPARFEWLLEKGTELGVAAFVPLLTARSVVRPEADGARVERWRRIVREAAEQCGRAALPEVRPPVSLADAVREAPGLRLVCWEAGEGPSLRDALRAELTAGRPAAVSLFVGPEGGLTEEEVAAACAAGARAVSLGGRVLRSETAGLTAAVAVLYELGELGG
ncbi:MAG TPA: 16S rRNA (uracil(1498)-N(3))-methyltransferase [Dehalococcoidia bacterium]